MKRSIVVTVWLLMVMSSPPSITYAQAIPNEVEWIRQFGGEGPGYDRVEAIAVHDGVYVAGSAGGALIANTAETGAFVRKYDASGTELWTRQFGDAGTGVTGIAVSDSGVHVTGVTRSPLGGQVSLGDFDGYIVKYSLTGEALWTRQFGTSLFDFAAAIAADAFAVYVVGHTNGTLPDQVHTGRFHDAFVRKYDSDGEEVWTRQFGTPDLADARGIALEGAAVYVVGGARGALPGQSSRGDVDAFVRRFDAFGNEAWTRQFGTSSFDEATAVAVSNAGVAIVGTTTGAFPGQVADGTFDMFVRVFERSGVEAWTRQFGTPQFQSEFARGIAADSEGIYVVGETSGQLPGQTRKGFLDPFLRKYDLAGSELWTRQFGEPFRNTAGDVAVDATGVYFGGSFEIVLFGDATIPDGVVAKYDASGSEVWQRRIDSTARGLADEAHAVTVYDGVYVAGTVSLPLPGQPRAGGASDVYVRKYDSAGNEIWTRQFGTGSNDEGTAVAVDDSGVYVAGHTFGTLPGQTRGEGGTEAFVRKYDHEGNELWTRQYGFSDFLDERVAAIAVSDTGVYVASNTIAFPGGVTDMVTVRKYDSSGGELWTRQFAAPSREMVHGIAADTTGVYLAGSTAGVLPGQQSSGNLDAFLRKYNPEGSELWTRQFGTNRAEFAFSVSIYESAVYAAGWTSGTFPGQTSHGIVDGYVQKFDSDGVHIWTRQFGTAPATLAFSTSADASGVYVTGAMQAFAPDGFPDMTTEDAFVAKYSSAGTPLWTTSLGTAGFFDVLEAIAVDQEGIFAAGITNGTFPANSPGGVDAFVVKLMNPVSIGFGTDGTDGHISLKRRQVQVTILSTADFDATDVDPNSVCFGTTEPAGRDCTESHGRGHTQDVNLDGRTDMLLHFDLVETNIDASVMEACVVGHTRADVPFKGCRAMRVK